MDFCRGSLQVSWLFSRVFGCLTQVLGFKESVCLGTFLRRRRVQNMCSNFKSLDIRISSEDIGQSQLKHPLDQLARANREATPHLTSSHALLSAVMSGLLSGASDWPFILQTYAAYALIFVHLPLVETYPRLAFCCDLSQPLRPGEAAPAGRFHEMFCSTDFRAAMDDLSQAWSFPERLLIVQTFPVSTRGVSLFVWVSHLQVTTGQ